MEGGHEDAFARAEPLFGRLDSTSSVTEIHQRPKFPHLTIEGSIDLERAVRGADVGTGTHARGWIVDDAWIEPGTHIAARHPPVRSRRGDQRQALQDSATVPLEYERAVAAGVRIEKEDDLDVNHAGISFEAAMTLDQAEQLARLMVEARPTRPAGVLTASLEFRDGHARLVAVWKDRETLDRYLSQVPVPRGTELMRKIGVEPEVRTFDILELG